MEYLDEQLTGRVIKAFYCVYNRLGFGFLEKVYHNAMMIELARNRISCKSQQKINVKHLGFPVGEYYADILVEDLLILELKAVENLVPEHELQMINYLKATRIEVGLLLNFGKKPEFKRKVFSNQRKNN
jgi:GxxExxY protein